MMIDKILKVPLKNNEYDSLCFLANHDKKNSRYFVDKNEAKSYFKEFLSKTEIELINNKKINYVMFFNLHL